MRFANTLSRAGAGYLIFSRFLPSAGPLNQ